MQNVSLKMNEIYFAFVVFHDVFFLWGFVSSWEMARIRMAKALNNVDDFCMLRTLLMFAMVMTIEHEISWGLNKSKPNEWFWSWNVGYLHISLSFLPTVFLDKFVIENLLFHKLFKATFFEVSKLFKVCMLLNDFFLRWKLWNRNCSNFQEKKIYWMLRSCRVLDLWTFLAKSSHAESCRFSLENLKFLAFILFPAEMKAYTITFKIKVWLLKDHRT